MCHDRRKFTALSALDSVFPHAAALLPHRTQHQTAQLSSHHNLIILHSKMMDEDTFIAIRALHNAFNLQYAAADDGDSHQQQEEEHHSSLEWLESTYDAYSAVNHAADAVGDSQQKEQIYPSMMSSDRDASSSSYNEIKYKIGTSSSPSGIFLQRLDMTTHSSLAAAILIIVVYPLIVTRMRSRKWVNRKTARLLLSEDLKEDGGSATSYSRAHDIMSERGFIDDVV